MAALQGIDTAEARAELARKEAELSEAQESLSETVYEHSVELSQTALDELSQSLSDAFDDYWDSVTSDMDEMMNLLQAANDIYAQSATEVVNTLNQLLSYYGIDTVSTGVLEAASYATGSRSLKGDQLTLTQEEGTEAIVLPDGSVLTPLPNGTSIFNADQTGNLWDWSNLNPYDYTATSSPDTSEIEAATRSATINVSYDNLLNVEGNVDSTVVNDLQKFAQQFYEGSYQYSVQQIKRDARKVGIKV